MLGVQGKSQEGIDFKVYTTDNRGFTPEELADMALNKLIHVSDSADQQIKAQAIVFKEQIRNILVQYMHKAITSYKTTLCAELNKRSQNELAELVKKI